MKSRTRFSKKIRGIQCLNCGQPISHRDNFCSNCGQVNDELPISIKQFISDFFSGIFNYDSRFFKTFRPLLFKPGKVPKDYIEGKRMKFVNPFQLYLNVTIIFFLIQGLFSAIDEYTLTGSLGKEQSIIANDSISKKDTIQKTKKNDQLVINTIDTSFTKRKSKDSIKEKTTDNVVSYYENYIDKNKKDSLLSNKILKTKTYIDSIFKYDKIAQLLNNESSTSSEKDSIFNLYYNSYMEYIQKLTNSNAVENWKQIKDLSLLKEFSNNYIKEKLESKNINYKLPEKVNFSVEDNIIEGFVGRSIFKRISDFMKYDNEHEDAQALEAIDSLGYEKSRWNVFYFKKAQDINKFKKDKAFRKAYGDSIISKISVALFFLLPIFTLFLSLLYIRGEKNYTEHLVFVFNVQTVFFLLLIFFTLINRIFKTDAGTGIFILVFLFYLYKAMRNFYKQNRIKTIIKFILLNSIYFVLGVLGIIIISFIAFVF